MNQDLLLACIASGQVSAAQVLAHHRAGDLDAPPPPQVAEPARKRCLACGRQQEADGSLPCGH